MSSLLNELLAKSIRPNSVVAGGNYTKPRTWGVYEISPPLRGKAVKKFRYGNHPVRQRELEADFMNAVLVALFTERTLAEDLARLLNNGIRA